MNRKPVLPPLRRITGSTMRRGYPYDVLSCGHETLRLTHGRRAPAKRRCSECLATSGDSAR